MLTCAFVMCCAELNAQHNVLVTLRTCLALCSVLYDGGSVKAEPGHGRSLLWTEVWGALLLPATLRLMLDTLYPLE